MKLSYFLNNALSINMAIDIGTNNTKIFIPQKGLVLDEPSYIACDIHTGQVCAVGSDAKQMYEKSPCTIKVIRPIENGVVANYEMAHKMIRQFIASVCDKTLLKPRVVVSVPADSTDIEKRAVCDILREAGSREIYLIEAPLAAAAGADCDISLARGMLIAEIGGAELFAMDRGMWFAIGISAVAAGVVSSGRVTGVTTGTVSSGTVSSGVVAGVVAGSVSVGTLTGVVSGVTAVPVDPEGVACVLLTARISSRITAASLAPPKHFFIRPFQRGRGTMMAAAKNAAIPEKLGYWDSPAAARTAARSS